FVSDGRVDYRHLQQNREDLDRYLEAVAKFPEAEYRRLSKADQIAFWINVYNARTLQVILDHYPIERRGLLGRLFPANSIRQIPGVWDKLRFPVLGKEYTLNDIEHEILRKRFGEPKIHFALVCASIGCPPLRPEAYVGERLDEQLDDQIRKFLADTTKFRIEGKRVYLSQIFKWFGEDFLPAYGDTEHFPNLSKEERAVLNFLSRYLPEEERQRLEAARKIEIEYLDYDWRLNERPPTS
ncbi:MAG: DUF547 domain-containing protein, partial [Deltaproteobacteria bacterium]